MKLSLRNITCFLFFILFSGIVKAQKVKHFSLDEATEEALKNNKLLQIQQEKANESSFKVKAMAAKGKPQFFASATYLHFFEENNFVIPSGGIGNILDVPIPRNDFTLYHGKQDIFTAGVLGYQPITQLFRVNNGVKAVRAQEATDRLKAVHAALKIQSGVEKLFYAIKIQERKIAKSEAEVTLAEARAYDAESALLAGKAQKVKLMGLKADLASKKHDLLQAKIEKENYLADFRMSLSIPDSLSIHLDTLALKPHILKSKIYYIDHSKESNPDLLVAQKQSEKAGYGIKTAKNSYIPDLGIVAGVNYQGIIEELPETNYFVGANLTWNFLDFGKRKSALNQSKSKQKQAALFAENKAEEVRNNIDKAYRNAEQAAQLMVTAQEAYRFRKEEYRIKSDGLDTGLLTEKEVLQTKVDLETAAQQAYAAVLNYNMSVLDLQVLAGKGL